MTMDSGMSRRRLMGLIAGGLTVSAVSGVGIYSQLRPEPVIPSQTPAAAIEEAAPKQDPVVSVEAREATWYSWQWVNLTTGERFGSKNAATETNNSESMIKAWIGADYLSRLDGPLSDEDKALITKMIRLSDDHAAQTLWLRGGRDAVVQRAIDECGLTGTSVYPGWWSKTQITAADSATLMTCILDRARTEPLVAWMVDDLMRDVDPTNAFGIAEVLADVDADAQPAVKNGWTAHDATNQWNLNCLAAWSASGSGDDIVLAVLTRYPAANGQAYGEELCRTVTRQLTGQLLSNPDA
jgi:beta-lactamase family protein